jgi:hypothetical protein
MRGVTIRTEELLHVLKENRDNHRAAFEKAQEGFKTTVEEELEKRLAEAREGKRFCASFSIPEPVDQTPEYDMAIKMLEMSVDGQTELTASEFACYVMDRWAWKHGFSSINSVYAAKAGASLESFGRAFATD